MTNEFKGSFSDLLFKIYYLLLFVLQILFILKQCISITSELKSNINNTK